VNLNNSLMQTGIDVYKRLSRHHTFNVRQVKVETTKVCNLACPGCRRNYKSGSIVTEPGPKHLTPGDLWRILATTNMMVVRFEGDGEPTCNPQFKELVKMCSSLSIRSAMTCNATLLDEDYVKFLEDHGMSRIHVSFDGTKKETFEVLRKGANFEKVLHNCELIGKSKIQLFMNVLLSTEEVVQQLPDYPRLAESVGATGVHFMKFQAENLEGFQGPDLSKFKGVFSEFQEEAKKRNLMYVSTITEEPSFSGCDDGFICPYVLLNNDVYACSYMANLRRTEVYKGNTYEVPYLNYRMGNLKDNWMKDIWKGEAYAQLRKTLKDSIMPHGTSIAPQTLIEAREHPSEGRFDYCKTCLCRWGESGI
jgi:MoaA/NifB/PqqE/SkfB family radical SAM enzyme